MLTPMNELRLWHADDALLVVDMPSESASHLYEPARAAGLDDTRRWLEVIAVTDPIDGAERDPLDLEIGIENLARIAAQYDDEEADARAARAAGALAPTFHEARRIALGAGRLRQRAAAINALEGTARAFALRLWAPLLATRPGGEVLDADGRPIPGLYAAGRSACGLPRWGEGYSSGLSLGDSTFFGRMAGRQAAA